MSALSQSLKYAIANTFRPENNPLIVRSLVTSRVSCKQNSGKGSKHVQFGNDRILPRNVEEINASAKAKFSPHRTRDSSSARIEVKMNQPSGSFGRDFMGSQGAKESSKINTKSRPSDSHVAVYDGNNSVSLSSVMQSNVPNPFKAKGEEPQTHLNMPGGQWGQGEKYVSGDLHDHHNKNIFKKFPGNAPVGSPLMLKTGQHIFSRAMYPIDSLGCSTNISKRGLCLALHNPSAYDRTHLSFRILEPHCRFNSCAKSLSVAAANPILSAWFKLDSGFSEISSKNGIWIRYSSSEASQGEKLTQRQKLKRAVKEYGVTVIVFHVTISLASLGFFYLLVSSGLDMSGLIDKLGINLANLEKVNDTPLPSLESVGTPNIITEDGGQKVKAVAAGVSTFVLAYAIHKVFAPVRIGITLTSTPFIVRHFRRIGVLKAPKST